MEKGKDEEEDSRVRRARRDASLVHHAANHGLGRGELGELRRVLPDVAGALVGAGDLDGRGQADAVLAHPLF